MNSSSPSVAACGQKLPRPDLPEPGMGYKHDAERFAAWRERWGLSRGVWTDDRNSSWSWNGMSFGPRYGGALTLARSVTCLDCGTPNEARFYKEQS